MEVGLPFLIEDNPARPTKTLFSSSPTTSLKSQEEGLLRRRKMNDDEFAASVGRSLRGGTLEEPQNVSESKRRRNHDHLRVEAESLRDVSPERPAPLKVKTEDPIAFLPTNLEVLRGRVAAF